MPIYITYTGPCILHNEIVASKLQRYVYVLYTLRIIEELRRNVV
jgi:hypothetical protein